MKTSRYSPVARILVSSALITAIAAALALALRGAPTTPAAPPQATPLPTEEIPRSQTIQPDQLAREMASKDRPIVVCVAPRFLYEGAHIPGALFHGPGSTTDGLNDLRHWGLGTARDRAVVLYCGCCPIPRCPNVRPALAEFRKMGFTHVEVLWLPKDFHTDWIEKGYPVEKRTVTAHPEPNLTSLGWT